MGPVKCPQLPSAPCNHLFSASTLQRMLTLGVQHWFCSCLQFFSLAADIQIHINLYVISAESQKVEEDTVFILCSIKTQKSLNTKVSKGKICHYKRQCGGRRCHPWKEYKTHNPPVFAVVWSAEEPEVCKSKTPPGRYSVTVH